MDIDDEMKFEEQVKVSKGCPFCGTHLIYIERDIGLSYNCLNCRYQLIFEDFDELAALVTWNRRANENSK